MHLDGLVNLRDFFVDNLVDEQLFYYFLEHYMQGKLQYLSIFQYTFVVSLRSVLLYS